MDPLSTREMAEACAHFAEIQAFVESELTTETREEIEKWIYNSILLSNPIYMMRPDAIIELNHGIFKHEKVSVFVTDLAYRFFATWSVGADSYKRLCLSLSNGLEIDKSEMDLCVIPQAIVSSMPVTIFAGLEQDNKPYSLSSNKKKITVFDFLTDNRHIVIAHMLYLTNKLN